MQIGSGGASDRGRSDAAGGIPALMQELASQGLLQLNLLTVTGKIMKEIWPGVKVLNRK